MTPRALVIWREAGYRPALICWITRGLLLAAFIAPIAIECWLAQGGTNFLIEPQSKISVFHGFAAMLAFWCAPQIAIVLLWIYLLRPATTTLGTRLSSRRQAHDRAQGWTTNGREIAAALAIQRGIPLAVVSTGKSLGLGPEQWAVVGTGFQTGEGHTAYIAPTGAGKGLHLSGTLLMWPAAAIVIDPKGEQFERTAAARQALGPVYRITDNDGIDLSKYYDLRNRDDLIELHGQLLRPWQDKEPAFATKSRELFAAIGEHAARTRSNPIWCLLAAAEANPIQALDILARSVPQETARFTGGLSAADLHENRFIQNAWDTFSMRLFEITHHHQTLTTQTIPLDWISRKATIYITYDLPQLHATGPAVSAIIAGLIRRHQRAGEGAPLLVAIDEVPAVALGNLSTYLATTRSAGVRFLIYVQNLTQLADTYGENNARAILANCQHQVWHAPNDTDTARILSEALGTRIDTQISGGSQTGGSTSGSILHSRTTQTSGASESIGETYRPRLDIAEAMNLPPTLVAVLTRDRARAWRFIGARVDPRGPMLNRAQGTSIQLMPFSQKVLGPSRLVFPAPRAEAEAALQEWLETAKEQKIKATPATKPAQTETAQAEPAEPLPAEEKPEAPQKRKRRPAGY